MAIEKKTHTVSDIVTYVERQFGDESGVQLTTADIIRWINAGQQEIAGNNMNINATFATTNVVANQDTYPLGTDPNLANIARIRSVRFNNQALKNITLEEAETYILVNTAQFPVNYGVPNVWYEDSGNLILYPKPLQDTPSGLTIHFTTVPKVVAATGDTLDIPDTYYNALVQFVMSQAYELDENFQASQVKTSQFEKSLGILSNRTTSQDNYYPTIGLEIEDAY